MSEATLPALDGDDGRASPDDLELERAAQAEPNTVVDIPLPLRRLDATGLGVPERIAATVQVDLSGCLLVSGD